MVDEIIYEDACHLKMDGTKIKNLDSFLKENDTLPNPLHLKKTFIEVDPNLPIYPQIPNLIGYHGPIDPMHICQANWRKFDVVYSSKEF